MKGNQQVIDWLNKHIEGEMTASHTYLIKAEICENLGLKKLAEEYRKEVSEERGHLQRLIARTIFLEGKPCVWLKSAVLVFDSVLAMLEHDLELELEAVGAYNLAAEAARAVGDNGSRMLFEANLKDEEHHTDWLESQIGLIKLIGLEKYLQEQI